jgi:hypothetical protein
MRRRQPERVLTDPDELPECLRAGACIEVWASDRVGSGDFDKPWWRARRAYLAAVDLWRELHGIGFYEYDRMPEALKRSRMPWSFATLAEQPERLAQRLRSYDLPPDWRPTPAPPEWRTTTPRRFPVTVDPHTIDSR